MQKRNILIIGLIFAAAVVGFSFFFSVSKERKYSQEFRSSEDNMRADVAENSEIVAEVPEIFSGEDYDYDSASIDTLLAGDNVQSSIVLGEVMSGGVGKDGIPSIQEPRLAQVSEVPDWIDPDGDGLFVERGGEARFYPYQVLVGHEIVNDTLAGEPLLVTYCPLCFTGVVYDPTIEGTVVNFGVSGKLWESNLLMYNRSNPESLWSQALGEAVVGPATGQKLKVVRFDITTYGKFASAFPDGSVVVGDAQVAPGSLFARSYGRVPYGGDLRNIDPIFPFSGVDNRLEKTDIVLGLVRNNQAKAYLVSSLKRDGEVSDVVGGEAITIFYNEESGIAEFYLGSRADGERLSPIPSFWISWISVHPDTALRP